MKKELKNKIGKKYNGFSGYYIDSNYYQMCIDGKIAEDEAIKSAAREFQFSVDSFSNDKVVDDIISDFYKK
jgi:hypothetical protein